MIFIVGWNKNFLRRRWETFLECSCTLYIYLKWYYRSSETLRCISSIFLPKMHLFIMRRNCCSGRRNFFGTSSSLKSLLKFAELQRKYIHFLDGYFSLLWAEGRSDHLRQLFPTTFLRYISANGMVWKTFFLPHIQQNGFTLWMN